MSDELDKAISGFLENSYVSNPYGAKNAKYYGKGSHTGTDYSAKTPEPVYGIKNWKVLDTYKDYNLGNVMVIINPQTGEKVRMAHLSETLLKKGDVISDDKTPIAITGNSGKTISGQDQMPHLHVEYIDPQGRLSDVTKANLFNAESRKAELDNPIVPSYQALIDKFKPKEVLAAENTSQQTSSEPTFKPIPKIKTTDYLVKHGDSLSKIAQQYGTTWQDLAKTNPSITNPNLIYSGDTIKVPQLQPTTQQQTDFKAGATTPVNQPFQQKPYSGNGYLIKTGDSLSKIARDLGTTVGTLMAKNNIENPNRIFAGKVLKY